MTEFILAAVVLTALVLWLLLRPLRALQLGKAAPVDVQARDQANALIYRQHKAQLDAQLASGELDATAHEAAWQELQIRLLQEAQAPQTSQAQQVQTPSLSSNKPQLTLLAVALALPLMAAALYALLGQPQALSLNPAMMSGAPMASPGVTPDEVERMVAGLAAKLEKEPDNLAGWHMLIRSYKALGRLEQAEQAYDKAAPYMAKDAQLLADYADISAANAGGQFAGKPQRLIDQALRVDPKHPLALWLAGTAAFERQDYPLALKHWEKLQTILPPDSEDAKTMALTMDRVRAKMSNSPKINKP
jgi:cytochrome c-type biogenesis protein CcmH